MQAAGSIQLPIDTLKTINPISSKRLALHTTSQLATNIQCKEGKCPFKGYKCLNSMIQKHMEKIEITGEGHGVNLFSPLATL